MSFVAKVSNLPKYLSAKELGEVISKVTGLESSKYSCRKNMNWEFGFVNFKTPEVFNEVIEKYKSCTWKNREISILPSDTMKGEKKRKLKDEKEEDSSLSTWERLNNQVTPLWKLSYEEQLQEKTKFIKKAMRKYWDEVKEWGLRYKAAEPIVPSPIQNGYRNKCEFAIGKNSEGEVSVGFSMGLYRDGVVAIESADKCLHVSPKSLEIQAKFKEYLQPLLEEFPVYDRQDKSGIWRLLVVRHQSNGQVMVMVQIHPQNLTEEQLERISSSLVEFFSSIEGVESIYWQVSDRFAQGFDDKIEPQLLHGLKTINENLNGLKFSISPSSFFQVNTAGAEVLYDIVGQAVFERIEKPVVLLDLCCGTGTIGMLLSRNANCERSIGIELVASAVEDAKRNAELNGISKCSFHCGKVEDVIDSVINSIEADREIVVVLDPPRAGTNSDVIKTIRKVERIKRVVYVSCSPSGAIANLCSLSRPASKQYFGSQFSLSKYIPVDMFPHTDHCELVLQFNRE